MAFENGNVQGVEIFIVRGGENFGNLNDYFAYVQCANGSPGIPTLLKIKMDGYDFTAPAIQDARTHCPTGEFHGIVSFDGITGSFDGKKEIKLPRKDSVWE